MRRVSVKTVYGDEQELSMKIYNKRISNLYVLNVLNNNVVYYRKHLSTDMMDRNNGTWDGSALKAALP